MTEASKIYIREAAICERLLKALDDLEESLDDASVFEQKVGDVLRYLDELDVEGVRREPFFTDLVTLLRLVFSAIECDELNARAVEALRGAVRALPRSISESLLGTVRQRLSESGVDLLRPFKAHIDVAQNLSEMFPDETTA